VTEDTQETAPAATVWNTVASDALADASGGHFELFFGYRDEGAFARQVEQLVADRFASRLAAKDHTLWGQAAEEESAKRLGWVELSVTSRPLIDQITALRDDLHGKGLTRVVLCGMGGSSLAPEVICEAAGVPLDVLDSSDPDFVRAALDNDLAHTVVVVSSKSGGTVETDSQRRAYEKAFADAGIDARERIVVVTDPGSPLDQSATEAGYRVFRADPSVGGRFSALTAFGLVPSGLAGADIAGLLDEAEAVRAALEADSVDNPALRLGALIGVATLAGVDKLVLCNADAPYAGFGDWAEQLIAESTGKDGKGVLPVIVESASAPNFHPSSADEILGSFGPGWPFDDVRTKSGWGLSVDASLGGQMLLWEHATAVAGAIIGINPFDQPDVESAKAAARGLLDGGGDPPTPAFTDGPVTVYASPGWLSPEVTTVHDAITELLAGLDPDHGYVAVQAYLDRHRDAALAGVRATIAAATERPVTFGWGPRFLHSTGQYHKGGPATGVYLQVTSQPDRDLAVPDRPFTFHEFLTAQAVGDGQVLAAKGRPVLRLHLDGPAHLDAVRQALA
jgi:glucose-6-phosphate isomerase